MAQANDSVSKNIQNQIANAQQKLQDLSSNEELDILPGEILVFDENGVRSNRDHCGEKPRRSCIFEYIYFARPDSVIDGGISSVLFL